MGSNSLLVGLWDLGVFCYYHWILIILMPVASSIVGGFLIITHNLIIFKESYKPLF